MELLDQIISSEATIRLGIFIALLAIFTVWEMLDPRRPLKWNKRKRWMNNFIILGLDIICVRIFVPLLPIAAAAYAYNQGWGVLNFVNISIFMNVFIGILLLDLIIYGQHVAFHKIPLFWRFHKVHHTDPDLDVSSGFRFHPLEILISLSIKISAVSLLGIHPIGVIIFEIILNSTSLFNHSNLNISTKADKLLRLLIVTPDMHRIHHSTTHTETDSNFCFNFPWWDKLFKTYTDQPKLGQDGMIIGITPYQDEEKIKLSKLLKMPFNR